MDDVAELALALRKTENAVLRLKHQSEALTRLPLLAGLLESGDIDLWRLGRVQEATENLSAADALKVDEMLAPVAAGLNASVLMRRAKRAVLKVDPAGSELRHEQAKQSRRVEWMPQCDGMAELYIYGPAEDLRRVYAQLDGDARALTDERTMDQRRFDVFVDRVLGAPGKHTVDVRVTVSEKTLLGLTNDPGHLEGYGAITASAARELATEGTWRKVLTDEVGNLKGIGKHRYRPPKALAEFVRTRDQHCRFPGCTVTVCDLDHVIRYGDGETEECNLHCLCRHHHKMKHEKCYKVVLDPDGTCHWTTPLGREYVTTPS
jgi:Domain of unknown function (DUF222)